MCSTDVEFIFWNHLPIKNLRKAQGFLYLVEDGKVLEVSLKKDLFSYCLFCVASLWSDLRSCIWVIHGFARLSKDFFKVPGDPVFWGFLDDCFRFSSLSVFDFPRWVFPMLRSPFPFLFSATRQLGAPGRSSLSNESLWNAIKLKLKGKCWSLEEVVDNLPSSLIWSFLRVRFETRVTIK